MSYDLIVIGAGPGGYAAAIRAAQRGAKVLVVERDELGGVCLNRGCIPTKAMIASAHILDDVRRAVEFGIDLDAGSATVDFKRVQERKNGIVEKLRGGIGQLFKSYGIEVVKGSAGLDGPGRVDVAGTKYDAKNILIATGSTWIEIPSVKTDGKGIVTTDEALDWTDVPKRLLVVGGGVIGCEFACMMRSFGSEVTVVEATPSILPPVERAISRLLARSMKQKGIEVLTGTTVERAQAADAEVGVALSNGEERKVDRVLVAVGRRPQAEGLGIETCGIGTNDRGAIDVDGNFKTSADNVYAIGDVIGGLMLAHAATAQGLAAVEGIFGKGGDYDSRFVPSPIFTTPEVAAVGETAEQLKERGVEFRTGRFAYAAAGKAQCDGETEGQAIVHADADGKLLGVHIIGEDATLLIPEAVLALRKGMSAKDIEETIHSHPTLSEVVSEAAADVYGMAINKAAARKR